MTLWKRIHRWRRRREFEAGLEEEMRFHREMSGGAAFGSVALAMEDSRAVWSVGWLESLARDVRYAVRGFRKSPGFVLAVVGTIGAALGLNTTLFTVLNAYVLRPFAIENPWSLYEFTWFARTGNGHRFTWAQVQDLASNPGPFSETIATENLLADVEGRTLFGELVSGNYFTMLGAGVSSGRPLLPRDAAVPGAGEVMVLGYDAWQSKFGGDPNLVGKTVHLRGHAFEVVGIANPAFTGLETYPASFWIPLTMHAAVQDGPDLLAAPQPEQLRLIGRLQPGVPVDTAKAALLAWCARIAGDRAKEQRPWGVLLESRATMVPLNRDAILTFIPILTVFGLVLLIACANVSNMMLARGLARQREIGIRISLGAGRARLVRQLLTESLLLAVPAALLGFEISRWTIAVAERLLLGTLPQAFARLLALPSLAPDWRVFGFILLASVAAAVVFGMAPALETTRSRLVEANRGDFSSDFRPARLRSVLLVTQVAVCSLLLIVTAVVLRSQQRITGRTVGMDLTGVWDITMTAAHRAAAAERLRAMPGVEAVAGVWHAPLYGQARTLPVTPSGSRAETWAEYNLVSAQYLQLFRIPILRGRAFTNADVEAPVAVISETAAHRFWPGSDPIGQTLWLPAVAHHDAYLDRTPAFSEARVIGVARDVVSNLYSPYRGTATVYFPTTTEAADNNSLLVRVADPSPAARRRITAKLEEMAPNIYDQINPMGDVMAFQIYPFQVTFWIAGFLGGLALLMTVSGIYGVLSYLVSQRTKEIGIRVALGASASDVVRMVVRESARLALIGVAAGAAAALTIAPVFAHHIEAIQPRDPLAYGLAIVTVMAAAIAASLAPSRRALRADPMTALRCD